MRERVLKNKKIIKRKKNAGGLFVKILSEVGRAARGTCFVWQRESQGLGLRLRSQLLLTPLRDIIS